MNTLVVNTVCIEHFSKNCIAHFSKKNCIAHFSKTIVNTLVEL